MKIDVLDHGYVRFVEAYGHGDAGDVGLAQVRTEGLTQESDLARDDYECGIVEAARQSTQASFRGWDAGDAKLLDFMFRNAHATPFEFAGMVLEVQAPIFVFREWHRHRTQSYNEMSARYAPMPDVHFVPSADRCLYADPRNKQAGKLAGAGDLTEEGAERWLRMLEDLYRQSEGVYQTGLAIGVPKEIARLAVTVARYSRMRAAANLRNWLGFATLRSSDKAQQEIRAYSDAVLTILRAKFPRTLAIFDAMRGHG